MQNPVKQEAEASQSSAIPFVGPIKDVAVTQLTQHAGMFPQGYLLPNGHTTTDFVQAQAAAQVKQT